jgi:hypothetical protein
MQSFMKHPKDFWTGVLYLIFALIVVVVGQDYSMGTALRMGPGYFPTILGILLGIVGAAAIIRSFIKTGDKITPFAWGEIVLVLASVVLFGVLARRAGLVPAIVLMVLMSAYASAKFKWVPAIVLAVGMTVFSILVFTKGLGVPLPILGPWFGQ